MFVAADGTTEIGREEFHEQYFEETGKPFSKRMLPAKHWWTNGSTLCETESPGGWSLGQFHIILPMLSEACSTLADTEFLFNRRDGPVLRDASKNDADNIKIPVIGFYEKKSVDDELPATREYAIPNYEDWATRESKGCRDPVTSRMQQAFFRGSTTGPGVSIRDNARLLLSHLGRCRESTILDAAPTRFNQRLRIFRTRDSDGRLRTSITFQRPSTFSHIHPVATVPFSKWSRWAITIYARGHAGATRFLRQLALGGVLIDFDPLDCIPADKQPPLPEVWASNAVAATALSHTELLALPAKFTDPHTIVRKHGWTHVHVTEGNQLYAIIELLLKCPRLAQELASNGRVAAVGLLGDLVTSTRRVIAQACSLT